MMLEVLRLPNLVMTLGVRSALAVATLSLARSVIGFKSLGILVMMLVATFMNSMMESLVIAICKEKGLLRRRFLGHFVVVLYLILLLLWGVNSSGREKLGLWTSRGFSVSALLKVIRWEFYL